MIKNKQPPFDYVCDKCKKEIFGGYNPTAFAFERGGFKGELCSPCYTEFWNKFNVIETKFVKDFLCG